MPHELLKKFSFGNRIAISRDEQQNMQFVLDTARSCGVYVVFADRKIERVRGESDILYIGRSGNVQRRMKYLLKYFLPADFVGNWGRHTARDALKVIITETDIKVSVAHTFCGNYKEVESELLQKYCKVHIEGPPLNNQRK
jgi:hypothetical protein